MEGHHNLLLPLPKYSRLLDMSLFLLSTCDSLYVEQAIAGIFVSPSMIDCRFLKKKGSDTNC